MSEIFAAWSHPLQAFIATIFTWGITALGACLVFVFRQMNKNLLDGMLGFSAGVMVAASFWSLLSPAIELAESLYQPAWPLIAISFLGGGLLLFCGDKAFDRWFDRRGSGGLCGKDGCKRCWMLIFSITLHNIPEGLAVGVAFGSLSYGLEGATLAGACLLAFRYQFLHYHINHCAGSKG